METHLKAQSNIQGFYSISKYKRTPERQKALDACQSDAERVAYLKTQTPDKKTEHDNIVVSSSGYGKNIVARQLIGDTTYAIEIDSAQIGDDNTTPTVSDTGLGNALETGISVATSSVSNNVVSLDFFMADGDLPNDTYEEFGIFCNGRLFARSIISPAYTKGSSEDTLINYSITL